jgi:glyoxylase-like metal-dependent hydrolase (beta-lactamase superfamily II)
VVDPGKDAAAGVAHVVREHRLKPVSVLLTHGHIDHMWSVTRSPAATTHGLDPPRRPAPCSATRWPGISPQNRSDAGSALTPSSREPDDVRELGGYGAAGVSPGF